MCDWACFCFYKAGLELYLSGQKCVQKIISSGKSQALEIFSWTHPRESSHIRRDRCRDHVGPELAAYCRLKAAGEKLWLFGSRFICSTKHHRSSRQCVPTSACLVTAHNHLNCFPTEKKSCGKSPVWGRAPRVWPRLRRGSRLQSWNYFRQDRMFWAVADCAYSKLTVLENTALESAVGDLAMRNCVQPRVKWMCLECTFSTWTIIMYCSVHSVYRAVHRGQIQTSSPLIIYILIYILNIYILYMHTFSSHT